MINAYLRADGRKGIRNTLVVAYLVECAHHVSREIYYPFREQGAHLIGFPGCFPNVYSHKMMERRARTPMSAARCWWRWAAKASTRASCRKPCASPAGR